MTSNFIQIAPYILLEFMYGDNTTSYVDNEVQLARIKNQYTNEINFINTNSAGNITNNVLNNTALGFGGNKLVYLNQNVPVSYLSTDNKFIYDNLSTVFNGVTIKYDTIRIHIQSGYQLEDIDGLILNAYIKENSGANSNLSSFVFLKSDNNIIFNPMPIMLSERMYNRYFDVLIPSIKDSIFDFYGNPNAVNTIPFAYSTDNKGFLISTSIYIKISEISKTTITNGFTYFTTSDSYEVSLNQEDAFGDLAANINESSNGDYFEYYPTYQGNFINDYIFELNRTGDYILVHEINVSEQIGTNYIISSSFSQIQESGFDQSLVFRPIIRNSDVAVSFAIDYYVKLYNKANGFSVLRRSSISSYNVRKYGLVLDKINLNNLSSPLKVYNKIVAGTTINVPNINNVSKYNTVYVPLYIDKQNIAIQNKTILQAGASTITPELNSENFVFGQGDCRLYLSDFNDYIQFKISQVDSKGNLIPLDLSQASLSLNFNDSTNNKLKYTALDSTDASNLKDGIVIFKIPEGITHKIFYSDNIMPFYITSESTTGFATMLYSGTVDKIDNISKEVARLSTLKSKSTISNTTASPIITPITNNNSIGLTASNSNIGNNNYKAASSIPGAGTSQGLSLKSGISPIQ